MRYSVQPRSRIFVKGCGLLSFAKTMGKNIGKNVTIELSVKYGAGMLFVRQKLLDHAKMFQQMHLESFKKEQKQLVIGNKTGCTTVKLQKLKKIQNKIIQRQLQMSMIKKYLKKDMYLHKKDKKLLLS